MVGEKLINEIIDPKELQKELLEWTKEELWSLKEDIVGWIKDFFGKSKIGQFFGNKLSALAASILWVEVDKEKDDEVENNNKIDPYSPSLGLVRLEKVTENAQEFGDKVVSIAQDLQINPNWLMHIMNKESWLNPQTENNNSWAVWLIQFNNDEGVDYKTINKTQYKISEIKNMNNLAQLDLVAEYYKPYKNKLNSYADLYLATLYPAAMWKPDDFVLWSEKSEAKAQEVGRKNNMNNWEPITVAHVKKRIAKDVPQNYIAQFDGAPQIPTTA